MSAHRNFGCNASQTNEYSQYDAGRDILLCQEREESMCQCHKAVEVDADFILKLAQIKFCWITKIVDVLDARIEEDTINFWEGIDNTVIDKYESSKGVK
jgi:hypothetical protein